MGNYQNNTARQPLQIEGTIEAMQSKFTQIAAAENLVKWAEESQFAIEVLYKNPFLQKCDPVSIQNAIINVASVGLTLNPAYGLAYLVPEYNKAASRTECQLRISFKGLMKVAVDSGAIAFVKAEIVCESDHFEYLGPCEKPVHRMNPFADRGQTTGVYCIAKTAAGDYLTDVMSKAEIDYIKSKAKTKAVWESWYGEMAKKAIIKRASKQWPSAGQSERFAEAVNVVNQQEGNELEGQFKVVQQEVTEPLSVQYYPGENFLSNFPKWQQAIQSGKTSPEALIAKIETRGVLTDQQKQQINAVGRA
ncbi:recombinase RecT [Endozoicomonas gorgoniicola]|uniref:Recombinase RecT n=1 Tax=Endozoicomonas gorgoniicola TaxID=1234144 RepID=A0ABT3N4A5_9GAMM|nr:recombinase RecT [Endozoicomonas gorgoniicola]MCW7556457.1 recombinase RecT [Endozoicomonas gorgoniicola]MCW7556522.1 recombinase RecT [Endozoicomonas gorgoniicola]